jgi:peptidoglycan L-alanyl-D-glutamate endopeptidase CwlK
MPTSAKALDPVTIKRINTAHPSLRAELLEIYIDICQALSGRSMCRFSFVLRSFAEQTALYAQGRRGKKGEAIVTKAKAGYSYHNYGLAVDIVLIIDGKEASWNMITDFDKDGIADWMEVVAVFKKYGWEWGGSWTSFKDYPHFQKTKGYKVSQLLAMYNAGQVDSEGYLKFAA